MINFTGSQLVIFLKYWDATNCREKIYTISNGP